MNDFCSIMGIRQSVSVLDLGGQPMIWEPVKTKLSITILNLPGIAQIAPQSHHSISYVEGDACNVTDYNDQSFDIVFSNSVIEHVGDPSFRADFAREVQRLGKKYWVQTPCKYFPIEPHNGMPFWWFYPKSLRRFLVERWRRKLPAWTEMIDGTDIVSYKELEALFPGARIMVERFMGLPKSYIVYNNQVSVSQ